MRTRALVFGIVLLIALSSGCADGEKPPPADASPGGRNATVMTICETCAGTFGSLRIGVGWIRESDYVDAGGEKRRSLMAVLYILAGEAQGEQRFNVHEGQRFEVGRYVLYVEEIRDGSGILPAPPGGAGGAITLRIEESPQV